MSSKLRIGVFLFLLCALLLSLSGGSVQAQTMEPVAPNACEDGAQASGAVYRICMPAAWNGTLVVFLHGYVPPTEPVGIPEDQVKPPDSSISIDQFFTAQGYAFVMSSYRTNGLSVQPAMADTIDALQIFTRLQGEPDETVLFGTSDGGLVATLMLERYPQIFRGGLGLCGPYGSFTDQVDYFGDFRVLFDYFFPEVEIPNSPIDIAPEVLADWETFYAAEIEPVVTNPDNADRVAQLLATAGAAFDPSDVAASSESTINRLLWYNVFATNDSIAKFDGQPFDNVGRVYSGSTDDTALNDGVVRYAADPTVRTLMASDYESTGFLRVPFLTMHAVLDPTVPYSQAETYATKVANAGSSAFYQHVQVPNVYGHCNFSQANLFAAFQAFNAMLEAIPPFDAPRTYLPLVVTAE